MMLAIHPRPGSFSDAWIAYCDRRGIPYKQVNAYADDILEQVKGCDAFLWHFHQHDYRDMMLAKKLILALEAGGVRCFPDSRTCWHFDDKVAQKYLLEAVGAPAVTAHVFYTKRQAFAWAAQADFPKVFKLTGGAGSSNVKLARTREQARRLIRRSFGSGFRQYRWREQLQEQWRKYREGKCGLKEVLRVGYYALKRYPTSFDHYHGREIGYVYFQDFVAGSDHDTRVVVIGGKRAMAETRYVRTGDFRASGSGHFDYGPIEPSVLEAAFAAAHALRMQSVAFDFIMADGQPRIIEMSYGFGTHGIRHCGGYWTPDLQWHPEEEPDFAAWMIEDLLQTESK